jgi:pimeloyl-ACP methyl ester carboxylesterase
MTQIEAGRTRLTSTRSFRITAVLIVVMIIASGLFLKPEEIRIPVTMKDYQNQELSWSSCFGDYSCANLLVPIDYKKLSKGRFSIKVLKFSARKQGEKIGSLVINPGGPGASGVNYAYNADYVFSPEILDKYDIIGFDPRGVGLSAPIRCLTDAELDESYAANSNPTSPSELQGLVREVRDYVAKCETRNTNILNYSTADAARDMDLLRSALREEKLNYLGVSYGTYLGTLYAKFFPDKVGRMVLDGAIDPNATSTEQNLTQAIGFDTALRSFIEDCYKQEDCPLASPASKAISEIISLFSDSADSPLTSSSDRPVTESLVVLGTASALYDSNAGWPRLREAIREAQTGVGTKFLALADDYTQRQRDGSYDSNESDAAFVIDCLDWNERRTTTQIQSDAETFSIQAPVFGPYLAYAGLSCQFFPALRATSEKITAIDTTPILIVGTTRDPATPYEWAKALNKTIKNSQLISLDGDGHTGYGHGSACVDSAVDLFFLRGKLPKKDLYCTSTF